jgi:hypothetical protein
VSDIFLVAESTPKWADVHIMSPLYRKGCPNSWNGQPLNKSLDYVSIIMLQLTTSFSLTNVVII